MSTERIAIVDGTRTPMGKMGGALAGIQADDLGAFIVKELINRSAINIAEIDDVIIGNCAGPAHAANIARVIALKAGIPESVPAVTVHRNCASGMESITTGADRLRLGRANAVVAGGVESMSNIPFLFSDKMKTFFMDLMRAKTPGQKLAVLARFRLKFLAPVIGLESGLTDPVCGLIMGMTAENIARDFDIDRDEQDRFSLQSHLRALAARDDGRLAEEITPYPLPPKYDTVMTHDEGPRDGQTLAALQKLRPYFDRKNGTVTVGSSSQVTDGAAAVMLMTESEAAKRNLPVLGYLRDYAYAGLDPSRMGLGPVYATSALMDKTGLSLSDFELVELNEAFAAQVLGCLRAFASEEFAKTKLGKPAALGSISEEIVNVNGGAIALGHPLGMTGTRVVITLLKELKRRGLNRGLATVCIGGGQGAALALEVA